MLEMQKAKYRRLATSGRLEDGQINMVGVAGPAGPDRFHGWVLIDTLDAANVFVALNDIAVQKRPQEAARRLRNAGEVCYTIPCCLARLKTLITSGATPQWFASRYGSGRQNAHHRKYIKARSVNGHQK